jgi:antitoxin component YwqK of YwqJK toxin-antitoxin module
MKKLTLTLLTCLIFLSPNMVLSETIDDLVKREGLYYKKFSEVPFSGKVTGNEQGIIKNGKWEGAFVSYHENGQLWYKGNWKNGKREGAWVNYHDNGQILIKGNYKNDKMEGAFVGYDEHGTVWEMFTGTFKNGKKVSD